MSQKNLKEKKTKTLSDIGDDFAVRIYTLLVFSLIATSYLFKKNYHYFSLYLKQSTWKYYLRKWYQPMHVKHFSHNYKTWPEIQFLLWF